MNVDSKLDRLFLHYFDVHFIADKGKSATSANFYNEMRLATRLAVASADTVYIPAASYFESSHCRRIIGELGELIPLGFIALSGGSPNLDEFVQERLDTGFYRENSLQRAAYSAQNPSDVNLLYMPRQRGSTRDIVSHWNELVTTDELPRLLRDAVGNPIPNIEIRLERVPKELGGLAFIPEYVFEVLDIGSGTTPLHSRIRSVVNEAYFGSYTCELRAGVVKDLRYLGSAFSVPSFGKNLSYVKMTRFLRQFDRVRELEECDALHLIRLGDDPGWRRALESAVSYVGTQVNSILSNRSNMMAAGNCKLTSSTALTDEMEQQRHKFFPVPVLPKCSVLCIAAAAVEFAAIRRRLEEEFSNSMVVPFQDSQDYAIKFTDGIDGTVWYLSGLSFQGETEAALGVKTCCTALSPSLVLMIGMCMGMPNRNLPVGTVVVPNEVFGFDHQRLTSEGTQYRPHGQRVDNGLYKLARVLASGGDFGFDIISDKGLASASVKIEEPQADLVKRIEETFPDAAAFDMEGWGFYLATRDKQCLWVKAVADRGEPQSRTAAGLDEKHNIQGCVTDNATNFALRVVRNFVAAARIA